MDFDIAGDGLNQPQLILFDCDGVLVDSEPLAAAYLLQELSQYGLNLTLADCQAHFFGGTIQKVAVTARHMGADLPARWADDFYGQFYAHLRKVGVPLIDGILDVLDLIEAANIPYCVVSNGPEEKMEITLGQNSQWDRFHGAIFSAHTYGVAKPDPELLLIAARKFGVAPKDCLMIDDSPTGCMGAANAGMRCIGYAERSDPGTLAATGATVIGSMAQLPPLLGL